MRAHAILVLGCGIDKHGRLTPDAEKSVKNALQAFHDTSTTWIIMSGSVSYKADFRPPISEAQAMKDCAVNLGAPAQKILVETESRDTFGNAYFTKVNLLMPLAVRHVTVVAGPNHSAERLEYIFEKVFADKISYEFILHGDALPPAEVEREQHALQILRALFDHVPSGLDKALYEVMRTLHPAYKS